MKAATLVRGLLLTATGALVSAATAALFSSNSNAEELAPEDIRDNLSAWSQDFAVMFYAQ